MADLSVFRKLCEILSLDKHQPKQHYIYDKTLAARIVCVLSAGAITLNGLNWKTACDGSWLTTNTCGVGRGAADVGGRCCISRKVSNKGAVVHDCTKATQSTQTLTLKDLVCNDFYVKELTP